MPVQSAVIGCGNFARYIHLPNIASSPDYHLYAVVDSDLARARDTAEKFDAPHFSADYHAILSDPAVELVFICTPHNLHAPMALDAVNAGKHVLVEKPMAIRLQDVRPIVEAVRKQGVTFTVGLNRRYSAISMKAKELVEGREYPLLINYRMVDTIWRHPWALDPEIGGGRLIAEAVHLFDLCFFMVGCEPVRIYAEGGNLTHPEIPNTQDNAVITLAFADGSIAGIMIGDLGNSDYPKDRVEMFFGERTVLIDDYQLLKAYGFEGEHDIVLPAVDKGFIRELVELAEAIRERRPAPITEIDGARATLCAVKGVEAIKTGQAQKIDLAAVIGKAWN